MIVVPEEKRREKNYLKKFGWKFAKFDEYYKLIDKSSTYLKFKKHEENYNKAHQVQIAQNLW